MWLQVEVHMNPGPYPQPTRATEETASYRDHRPEDKKHGKGDNSHFAISISATGVAVNIGQHSKSSQHQARNEHSTSSWREVVQQFLQSQEIPGGLCRIWRHIWVSRRLQR